MYLVASRSLPRGRGCSPLALFRIAEQPRAGRSPSPSLPLTLSAGASIQNGHINLIISSVIRLADEERLGTDVGYPYPG